MTLTRQLRYEASDNSIDLALLVNGIPTATAELKNPLTGQTIENAIEQYRTDRDPSNLTLKTWINGELRQNGTTSNLIFDVPAIISFLSQQLTLEPGDVIATGTPSGVGLGMKPQVWLQPGDTIRMEIEGLGAIENEVVAA